MTWSIKVSVMLGRMASLGQSGGQHTTTRHMYTIKHWCSRKTEDDVSVVNVSVVNFPFTNFTPQLSSVFPEATGNM